MFSDMTRRGEGMKKRNGIVFSVALLLFAVMVCPGVQGGDSTTIPVRYPVILADFSGKTVPDVVLNQGAARNQKLEFESESGALRIHWARPRTGYWEWHFAAPPLLSEYSRAEIRVKLTAESSEPIDRISLRLVDATGEVLQFMRPVPWNGKTQCEVVWNLDPASVPDVAWGGNEDRKPDLPLRFLGVSGDFPEGEGMGAMRLSSIAGEFETRMKRSEAVEFELDGTGPVQTVRPGTPVRLFLRNRTLTPVTVQASAIRTDFDGNRTVCGKREADEPFALAPGERREFAFLAADELRPGIHWLEFRVADPENPADETVGRDSFAVLTPSGPTPGLSEGFLFGICSHPNWTENREIQRREAEAMALVGAKILRLDFEWQQIEPEKGKIDCTLYDDLVEIFAEQGVEFEAILGKPPRWAETKGNLPDYDEWRRFVRESFRRYRGKIRYWEVWNEPDLTGFATFSAPEYAELMRIVREERDAVAPEVTLLTGGFATLTPHGSKKEGFQEESLRLGKGNFDVHAYHEHGGFPQFVRIVDEAFLPMRRSLGVDEPWYANETAINSTVVSEREQAITLVQKLVFAWSRGSIGYNWYNLRNKGDDPKNEEQNYGMITADFRPKAVYVAFNTLTRMLQGHEFVREHEIPGGMLFEFRNGTERVLCGWRENSGFASDRKIALRADEGAELIDLMGNSTPAVRLGGTVLLLLGESPVFLRLPGDSPVEIVPAPVTVSELPLAVPGRTFELPVELSAPGESPAEFELELSSKMPEVAVEPATASLKLDAGERRIWKTTVTIAPDFRSERAYLWLTCRIPELGYVEVTELPLRPARLISARIDDGRSADFVLNWRNQVTSLFNADPAHVHLLWGGPEDLSAQAWIGADPEHLVLRIEVTDDKHVQPFGGDEAWKGDNVQVAMAFPGERGLWELGFTRLDSGESECAAWSVPAGFDPGVCARSIRLRTERVGNRTVYGAEIPLAALGVARETLRKGFRVNLLVNDNDGGGREGWITLAPGIGEKKDPAVYPYVMIP